MFVCDFFCYVSRILWRGYVPQNVQEFFPVVWLSFIFILLTIYNKQVLCHDDQGTSYGRRCQWCFFLLLQGREM